jgi:hypothetical protein
LPTPRCCDWQFQVMRESSGKPTQNKTFCRFTATAEHMIVVKYIH